MYLQDYFTTSASGPSPLWRSLHWSRAQSAAIAIESIAAKVQMLNHYQSSELVDRFIQLTSVSRINQIKSSSYKQDVEPNLFSKVKMAAPHEVLMYDGDALIYASCLRLLPMDSATNSNMMLTIDVGVISDSNDQGLLNYQIDRHGDVFDLVNDYSAHVANLVNQIKGIMVPNAYYADNNVSVILSKMMLQVKAVLDADKLLLDEAMALGEEDYKSQLFASYITLTNLLSTKGITTHVQFKSMIDQMTSVKTLYSSPRDYITSSRSMVSDLSYVGGNTTRHNDDGHTLNGDRFIQNFKEEHLFTLPVNKNTNPITPTEEQSQGWFAYSASNSGIYAHRDKHMLHYADYSLRQISSLDEYGNPVYRAPYDLLAYAKELTGSQKAGFKINLLHEVNLMSSGDEIRESYSSMMTDAKLAIKEQIAANLDNPKHEINFSRFLYSVKVIDTSNGEEELITTEMVLVQFVNFHSGSDRSSSKCSEFMLPKTWFEAVQRGCAGNSSKFIICLKHAAYEFAYAYYTFGLLSAHVERETNRFQGSLSSINVPLTLYGVDYSTGSKFLPEHEAIIIDDVEFSARNYDRPYYVHPVTGGILPNLIINPNLTIDSNSDDAVPVITTDYYDLNVDDLPDDIRHGDSEWELDEEVLDVVLSTDVSAIPMFEEHTIIAVENDISTSVDEDDAIVDNFIDGENTVSETSSDNGMDPSDGSNDIYAYTGIERDAEDDITWLWWIVIAVGIGVVIA